MVMGVGNRIYELRNERGLTMDMLVADLNTKYGVEINKPFNKSMLSRWERDENNPSLDNAKMLCDYFDVSLDYLIGNTDVRVPSRLLAYATRIKKTTGGNQ